MAAKGADLIASKSHAFFNVSVPYQKLAIFKQVIDRRALEQIECYVDTFLDSFIGLFKTGGAIVYPEIKNKYQLHPKRVFIPIAEKLAFRQFVRFQSFCDLVIADTFYLVFN